MKRAQVVLNELAHHFDESYPLSDFLQTRAPHLLTPPTGDTGIPLSFFNIDNLNDLGQLLEPIFTKSQFSRGPGVYYFFTEEGVHNYCGSATDLLHGCVTIMMLLLTSP